MRRAANIDGNQPEIVAALRKAGATVQTLAAQGKGVPDLLIGFGGRNILAECKDPNALRGRAQALQLTPDEARWHDAWLGQVTIITSVEEALALLGLA